MHLVDGAEAIAGDLPRAATARVEVPPSAARRSTPASGASARFAGVQAAMADRRRRRPAAENVLVIGGDCGVAVPAIAHAAAVTTSRWSGSTRTAT
jgi:arginase